ncbi:hypothetical protein HPP92_000204 [Vanilla planifolia]|uniref:Uncharacterized protein n=1 Tax=Vanilla planifolia TaxID=51239 RepID=A0A835RVM3_VANPL|nr:hypothetical protein HPP92_000142 [Vanilla planifolia]KAG0500132.1 hypothetical protein HPP92_000204 [Vanilla planifolia]
MSKADFNRLCLQVLGRQNIPLHNQLIRSILKNAYLGKTPPAFVDRCVLKLNGAIRKKPLQVNDSASQFYITTTNSLIQCNGNGILCPCDWRRPLQNHQGRVAEQPTKKPRNEVSSLCDQIPIYVKNLIEPVAKEDGEKTKENSDVNYRRTRLQPPLGIHFCPALVSLIQRFGLSPIRDRGRDDLYHSKDLRNWMEKITKLYGLGVTLDCANFLNSALDIFLKRLIRSSFELAGAKSMPEQIKHPF